MLDLTPNPLRCGEGGGTISPTIAASPSFLASWCSGFPSEESPDLALHHRLRDGAELRRVLPLQLGKLPLHGFRCLVEAGEHLGCLLVDVLRRRAALFAPPTLLPITESIRETVAEGFARVTDPEGFERRGLLTKALAAIKKRGNRSDRGDEQARPSPHRTGGRHDVTAAKPAERLANTERVRDQAESGNGPVIYPGKGPGLYSATLLDLPAPRAAEPEPIEES